MFEATKPTKDKTDLDFDGLDDILNPSGQDFPVAGLDDEPDDTEEPSGPGFNDLPTSSSADTKRKVGAINPTDQMRDFMGRINPNAVDVGDDPEPPADEVVLRTASDVPKVISSAMRAAGVESPEWHKIRDLPGMNDRVIRSIGKNVFSAFTSTPQDQIKTIANVNGQGPNTNAEIQAVANWLLDNALRLPRVEVDYGDAIPGYKPEVQEFSTNGVRFHLVRDPMGNYIYAYPEKDARTNTNQPRLTEMIQIHKPTLFESMQWDEELEEAFIEESSLSKLLGKQPGGQNLVRWLHRRHKLSNDADFEPAPFNKEILWKQFKSNPDDFVIVSAENGVAGIKPSEKFIKDRTAEFAKKGKQYNPANDATVPYQVIAFTDDGQQVDPELLRPQGDGDDYRDAGDPTVSKARMGKHTGREMQNPDNVFNLLSDQIGRLKTVWKSGFSGYRGDPDSVRPATGSIERDKMAKRTAAKAPNELPPNEAMSKILQRVRPVLKKLGDQAYSQIMRSAKRYIDGGNFDAGQKIMASGKNLKQFLVSLDTQGDLSLNGGGPEAANFKRAITQSISKASGASPNTDEFNQWMNDAAQGNSVALKPVLDGLREVLVNIPSHG